MSNKTDKTSIENNVKSLNEIAQKLRKRTTSLNLIDPQVSRTPSDWKDVFSGKPLSPDRFSRKVSYKVNDFRITLRVNDEYLVADIRGAFNNSIICSFVTKSVHNPAMYLSSNAICRNYGFKVFVDSNLNSEKTISFLQNRSFQRFVNELRLSPKESLHIGYGWASLYLQRFMCDDVLQTLDTLYQLLALLPFKEEMPISFEGLPEQFKILIPLMKRWSISDDNDRSEKLSKASSKTLTRLVQVVTPNFDKINQYLDSFEKRPLSEHAILLGSLAECAVEAQLLLKARE
jgi:hypothetical protein